MRILGIDIRSNVISAVVINRGKRGSRIETHIYNYIPEQNEFENTIEKTIKTVTGKEYINECIVSFPENFISYRNIFVPFNELKKLEKIIKFQLEPSLPFPVEELLIDFKILNLPGKMKNTPILAACVEKNRLKSYLKILLSYNLNPKIITIGGYAGAKRVLTGDQTPETSLFIDITENYCTLFLAVSHSICLVRPLEMLGPDSESMKSVCQKIERTIISFADNMGITLNLEGLFVSGHGPEYDYIDREMTRIFESPVKKIDIIKDTKTNITDYGEIKPGQAAGAAALALTDKGFNFRKGEFAIKNRWSEVKGSIINSGIIAAICIFIAIANMIFETHVITKKVLKLETEIINIFKETLPEVKRIVDPLHQIRVKLEKTKKDLALKLDNRENFRVIDILNEISKVIPPEINVKLTSLNVNQGLVLISGTSDTFNAVDDIKVKLEGSNLFKDVRISTASQEKSDKKINFKIKASI